MIRTSNSRVDLTTSSKHSWTATVPTRSRILRPGSFVVALTSVGYVQIGRLIDGSPGGQFHKSKMTKQQVADLWTLMQRCGYRPTKMPNGETTFGMDLGHGYVVYLLSSAIAGLLANLDIWPARDDADPADGNPVLAAIEFARDDKPTPAVATKARASETSAA